MADTHYDVHGNPLRAEEMRGDEIFTTAEMEAIFICSANIDAIVDFQTNGQSYLTQTLAARDEAATHASAASTSAVEADASEAAAAASATAASDSADAADASRLSAAASAAAAATSEANAASAAASIPGDVASFIDIFRIGAAGQAIIRIGPGELDFAFADIPVQAFLTLSDVVTTGIADGMRPYYEAATQKIKFSQPAAATNFADLNDVEFVGLQDGHIPRYELASAKFKNVPLPTGGGSGPMLKNATAIDDLTFSAIDVDAYRILDCAGGGFLVEFSDAVDHDPNTVLQTVFNIINSAPGAGIQFKGTGAVAAAPPPMDPVGHVQVSSGVSGQALTNAQNVNKNITIPAGTQKTLFIIYSANPATAATATLSPSFNFNSQTNIPWDYYLDGSSAAPRVYVKHLALGDLAAPLATQFKPNWTDYGGHGNVARYDTLFVSFNNGDQTNPADSVALSRATVNDMVDQMATMTNALQGNRIGLHVVFRRGNTNDDAVDLTEATSPGFTQNYEGHSTAQGNTQNLAAQRCGVATTEQAANTTKTSNWSLGTVNAWSANVAILVAPLLDQMRVRGRGGTIDPIITRDGLVGVIYDKHDLRVEIGA